MASRDFATPRRKLPLLLVLLALIIAALVGAAIYLRPRFESQAPVVKLTPDTDVLGVAPMQVEVSDPGTGIRSLTITLASAGTEHRIVEQSGEVFPQETVVIDPAKIAGLKEGSAVLRVRARDAS